MSRGLASAARVGCLGLLWLAWIPRVPLRGQAVRLTITATYPLIGGESSDPSKQFASNRGGLLLSYGRLAVVDRGASSIRVFTIAGDALGTLGRAGHGPGELMDLAGLARGTGDTLVLFDPAARRLSTFGDGRPRPLLAGTSSFDRVTPSGFCISGKGQVYLQFDQRTGTILHLEGAGKPVDFGDPVFPWNPKQHSSVFLNNIGTIGPLACSPQDNTVLFAPTWLGRLYIYRLDGRRAPKLVPFPDFRESVIEIRRDGGASISYPMDPATRHTMASVVRLPAGRALVQFGLRRRDEHSGQDFDYEAVETRIIDLATGRIIGSQSDLPVILDIRGDLALLAGAEPAPWVRVAKIRIIDREARARR